ncbi:MAG: hypothetical protein NC314_10975 [Roseburia sp.]|nr:hypothetical protein [Roseburia sp.]MCM1243355.1 hypothetical protein [Roseburia sp.]
MAAFFPDLLEEFLTPSFLDKVRDKFHYGETQEKEFREVARKMYLLMQKEAFWESAESTNVSCTDSYADVVISLGAGLDSLQEQYSRQGMLSKSYMLEVLAGELLMQAYGAYNRYIGQNTDWHVARYHFPGSEDSYPLQMLPHLLEKTDGRVTCNEAFCMMPKKSVAFVAELTQDKNVRCEGICIGCGNVHCSNRTADDFYAKKYLAKMTDLPLTYGYSRIFGKL